MEYVDGGWSGKKLTAIALITVGTVCLVVVPLCPPTAVVGTKTLSMGRAILCGAGGIVSLF